MLSPFSILTRPGRVKARPSQPTGAGPLPVAVGPAPRAGAIDEGDRCDIRRGLMGGAGRIFGIWLFLGAWGALAAWLPTDAQSARTGPDSAGRDAVETVRFWVPARGGYLSAWREAARRARERHPELAIAVEPIWADYGARLTLALAKRQAPDLASSLRSGAILFPFVTRR